VGPQFEAARASLGGTTKKSDAGARVDLNSLANRTAAAGNTVASGLALPSGAGAPIQSNAISADSVRMLHGDATGVTSTTAGRATQVVPVAGLQPDGAASSVPGPHAEAVIRGQINPAAKSCYENDPSSKTKQPGKLVILIKLTPTGEIDSVSVPINMGLSPSVTSCITNAARAAKFAAPGANGASVPVVFTFPRHEDRSPAAAARASGAQVTSASGQTARDTSAKPDTVPSTGETAAR
jgi:hypothetical protein